MGNVINLNKFRKRKAKEASKKRAETNRRLHGRTKAERQQDELRKRRLESKLEGARLEDGSDDGSDASRTFLLLTDGVAATDLGAGARLKQKAHPRRVRIDDRRAVCARLHAVQHRFAVRIGGALDQHVGASVAPTAATGIVRRAANAEICFGLRGFGSSGSAGSVPDAC